MSDLLRPMSQIGRTTGYNILSSDIPVNKNIILGGETIRQVTSDLFKSSLEKQMSELGVKTERVNLGLQVDGTTRTGLKIDELLKNNLGRTFKTFDNFEAKTGTATSVKSINLNAKTYQNGSGLSSKIKGDINATLDFVEYRLNNKELNSADINKRIVNIVIDDRPLNQSQIENLKKAVDYGRLNNVEVKVTINGGK